MPRKPRRESESGTYHIMVRGNNKQNIFHDEEDKDVYLERLFRFKNESSFEIYAYCIMNNHVHILIKESDESISDIMKRIGVSYAYWYNQKYNRIGHVFQDRFKSEAVESDKYLLTVTRYIHQNPVKVGLRIDYWTSYNSYIYGSKDINTSFILEMFSSDKSSARRSFVEFMNKGNDDVCLEIDEAIKLSDSEANKLIENITKAFGNEDLRFSEISTRNKILRYLKKAGASTRQLSKITGISKSVIQSA